MNRTIKPITFVIDTPQMILQLQSITDEREQAMNHLWTQFQQVLSDYLQRTAEFHGDYLELRKRDDEDTQLIRFHYAEVLRCTEVIADLKHGMAKMRADHAVQMEALQRYKRLLVEKLAERKAVLEDRQRGDKESMRWMVVCSNEAITVSCGFRVEICNKYLWLFYSV